MQKAGFSAARLRRLSSTLQDYVDRGELAGAVAMIHRKGEEAYAEAIGWQDQEARLPVRRDTLFRIMSMTKPITAAAALLLVEEGKLRLHDPVDAWLPELANRVVLRKPHGEPDDVVPAARPITLHDLLTSRIGIGWEDHRLQADVMKLLPAPVAKQLGVLDADEQLDPDAWMKRLGKLPLIVQPGTRFLYHIAHEVLGVLIARVSGQPLDAFFRERIFGPLGMKDTSFTISREKQSRLSVAYAPKAGGGLVELDRPESTEWAKTPVFLSGGAGLLSTADDYQRFGRMLLGLGELDGVRLLARKSVEAMISDHFTPEQRALPFFDETDYDGSPMWTNKGYGYGVSVRTKQIGIGPSVGSFFWPGALGSTWIADPREALMATLLIQRSGAQLPKNSLIAYDFWTMIYQAIND
ncbi:CubicO group peptidase, beta-lactamase class C family [Paenibacillus sp. UNC496MF]|uniref:serine hydrolase domain-containing protein n=1 Tax=Paenibacillus sp. UNC496MF TaxID=1502753 RepID=UPI0008E5BD8D|nr:serine hydrolase domain-containing protein [Paenibacillus sp. UNC496MF]SFI41834.1 CubicO group peptidase, beta-lactamase class C family [Paenibacillus sp. UNC496MF]